MCSKLSKIDYILLLPAIDKKFSFKNMRYLSILFIMLLGDFLHADPVLRVGMELSYPPFEMVCPNGNPCGISVDIAKSLGDYLRKKVVIENMSFIGLIPALDTDKIDLIISSLTVDQQRKKAIDFSIPYASIGLALLVNINSDLENIEQADAPNRIIVVKSGTTGEMYARKNLKKAQVLVLDRESLCILEVIQGKADAFIYDQLSVYTAWKKNPEKLKALLKPFDHEKWAIGIKKGNTELLNEVNNFVEKFNSDQTLDKLTDKYLKEQKIEFKKLNIPFIL